MTRLWGHSLEPSRMLSKTRIMRHIFSKHPIHSSESWRHSVVVAASNYWVLAIPLTWFIIVNKTSRSVYCEVPEKIEIKLSFTRSAMKNIKRTMTRHVVTQNINKANRREKMYNDIPKLKTCRQFSYWVAAFCIRL